MTDPTTTDAGFAFNGDPAATQDAAPMHDAPADAFDGVTANDTTDVDGDANRDVIDYPTVITRAGTRVEYDSDAGRLLSTDSSGSVRTVDMPADEASESLRIIGAVVELLGL